MFAILLTGIAKGGFGAGSGGLAVPLMSIFIAPPEAAGIMLPILCAMDLFGVHAYRGRWSRAHLAILLPGALVGIAAGALRVRHAARQRDPPAARRDRRHLRAQPVVPADRAHRARASRRRERAPGAVAGVVLGRAVRLHQHARARRRPAVRRSTCCRRSSTRRCSSRTSVVFFLVVNYVKLVPYAFLGQLNAGNLAASLLFAPLAPLGIWLGVWLHRRMSERGVLPRQLHAAVRHRR